MVVHVTTGIATQQQPQQQRQPQQLRPQRPRQFQTRYHIPYHRFNFSALSSVLILMPMTTGIDVKMRYHLSLENAFQAVALILYAFLTAHHSLKLL